MNSKETILEIKGINKYFPGVKALDDVKLSVCKGEIHAIVGENGAGKSTLMNIILGIHQPDSGEVYWKGENVNFRNPLEALSSGISMIHQEMNLVQSVSVAENIWIGREKLFTKFGILNTKLRNQKTKEILESLDINLDPNAIARTLSVAQMQMVEIVRAISYNSDLIIMDEPTSALSETEIQLLFTIIRKLSSNGVTILFISHKLNEILEISDRVTALRDGRYIITADTPKTVQEDLVKWIVGRELNNMFPKEIADITDVALEVKNLGVMKKLYDINFFVRKGEILGFCGLIGSGRTEVMRAIFGIDKYETGKIFVEGKPALIKSPKQAIRYGMGMLTEDRLRLGIFKKLPVRTNISLVYLKMITSKLGFVNQKKENADCEEMKDRLNIKIGSMKQIVSGLSGGNQQKCIIARWLLANPRVLILDEPTRGIDVGSKAEIHHQISLLAQHGIAIILVSSELPEILGMSDRIMVMRDGRIAGEFIRGKVDQEKLMQVAFGS